MGRTAKAAGLAVVVVLITVLAGCSFLASESTVAAPAVATPTPTRTATTGRVSTPSATTSIDLAPAVKENKLYTAGKVPTVSCRLPNTVLSSKAVMLSYARIMVDCMSRAWAPVVARSDAYFEPPKLFAYDARKPSATPECADPPPYTDAFYRHSTRTICFEWRSFIEPDYPQWNLIAFQQLISHEFGHHVQLSVGILSVYDWAWWGSSEARRLEAERRKELQASCLGAAFLGANKRAFRLTGERHETWEDIVKHIGDEYHPKKIRDHGSRKNHGYWSIRAFDSASPASCNTFTAPAKRVS